MPPKPSRLTPRSSYVRGRVRRGGGLAALAVVGALALPASAVATQMPLLYLGSKGGLVAQVQRALHLKATGTFGRKTKRAVIAFQRRDKLLVDGIVGPQTWGALFGLPAAPAPPAGPSTAPAPARPAATSAGGGYAIPAGIVQCESGGNYSAVNPSSGAGGAYQILPSTWRAYGGQGLPQNASPAEQNRIAGQIYATQGRSAWTC